MAILLESNLGAGNRGIGPRRQRAVILRDDGTPDDKLALSASDLSADERAVRENLDGLDNLGDSLRCVVPL